jgi:transposase
VGIEAVAMDMSPAYHEAVSTHVSKATIVYDRFHCGRVHQRERRQA